MLAAGTATVVVVLGAVASWLVVRTKLRGRWLVDGVASCRSRFRASCSARRCWWSTFGVPIPIYGTLWILLIAFVTAAMPSGMRFSVASMQQLGDELEESARTSGASWWQTFRRVLLPLMVPGLAAGWLYLFVVSARQLSSAILLYSPGQRGAGGRGSGSSTRRVQFTRARGARHHDGRRCSGRSIAIAYKLGGVLGVVPR